MTSSLGLELDPRAEQNTGLLTSSVRKIFRLAGPDDVLAKCCGCREDAKWSMAS